MLVPPNVKDPPCIQNMTGFRAVPGALLPSLPPLPPLRLASAPGASGSGAYTLRKRQALQPQFGHNIRLQDSGPIRLAFFQTAR